MSQCSNVLNLDMDFSLEKKWGAGVLGLWDHRRCCRSRHFQGHSRGAVSCHHLIIATICMFPSWLCWSCYFQTSSNVIKPNCWNLSTLRWTWPCLRKRPLCRGRFASGPTVGSAECHQLIRSDGFCTERFRHFTLCPDCTVGIDVIVYSYYMISWDSGVPLDVTC